MKRVLTELTSSRGTLIKFHSSNKLIVNWSEGHEAESRACLQSAGASLGSERRRRGSWELKGVGREVRSGRAGGDTKPDFRLRPGAHGLPGVSKKDLCPADPPNLLEFLKAAAARTDLCIGLEREPSVITSSEQLQSTGKGNQPMTDTPSFSQLSASLVRTRKLGASNFHMHMHPWHPPGVKMQILTQSGLGPGILQF